VRQQLYPKGYLALLLSNNGQSRVEESEKVDKDMAFIQKQLFDRNWELAKTHRELKMFKNISLAKYVRSVFFVRQST